MDPSLPELLILLLLKTRLSPFAGRTSKILSFYCDVYFSSSSMQLLFWRYVRVYLLLCFLFEAWCNVYCDGFFVWLQPANSAEREKTTGWIVCALFSGLCSFILPVEYLFVRLSLFLREDWFVRLSLLRECTKLDFLLFPRGDCFCHLRWASSFPFRFIVKYIVQFLSQLVTHFLP